MGLCGGTRQCGCAITSTPATEGAIEGQLPSITVSGSGQAGDPYDLELNDAWAAIVAREITHRGIKAKGTSGGANQVGIASTQTDITGCSASFTAVADRIYKVTLDVNVQQQTAAAVASVTMAHGAATRLMGRDWSIGAGVNAAFCMVWTGELPAGPITVKGRAETSAGTVTIMNGFDRSARILVEDIGAA